MNKSIMITVLLLSLVWPGPVHAQKVLNNFATELLDVSPKSSEAKTEYSFRNPRQGWVFLRGELPRESSGSLTLSVDSKADQDGAIVHAPTGPVVEGMRYLSAGEHSMHIKISGANSIGRLIVRTMPEIIYANFPWDSLVTSYPKYDWEFLGRVGLLDYINTIVATATNSMSPGLASSSGCFGLVQRMRE